MPSSDAGEASRGSGMTEGAVKSDEAWLKNNPKKRKGVQRKNKIKSRARDVLTAMADGKTPPKLQKRCKNDWQNCVGVDTPGLKQAFAQVAAEEKFAVLVVRAAPIHVVLRASSYLVG